MNIAKISNFNLSFSNTFNILNATKYAHLSLGARATYSAIYNWYRNNVEEVFVEEGTNEEFIELARTEIAKLVKVSVKTVIGYIKELSRVKLIRDKRMGAKEFNRISFYDVDEKYKYGYKQEQKNTTINDCGVDEDDSAAQPTNETTGLIKQVKDMVFEAFEDVITNKDAKAILIVSNSNIEDISEAIKYNVGKSYDNLVGKLSDCIRRRLWTKLDTNKGNKKQYTKPPNKNIKPNNGRFTNISSHNWDIDKLEQQEQLHQKLQFGEISQDEYNELSSKL